MGAAAVRLAHFVVSVDNGHVWGLGWAICSGEPLAQAGRAAWPQCRSSSRPVAAPSRLLLPPASQLLLPGGLKDGLGRVPHSQLQAGKAQEGMC